MTGRTKDEISLWGIFVFLAADVVFAGYGAMSWFAPKRESSPAVFYALVMAVVVSLIVVGYAMFARIESSMDDLAEYREREHARLKSEGDEPPGEREGRE